jgi:hypothetical protein
MGMKTVAIKAKLPKNEKEGRPADLVAEINVGCFGETIQDDIGFVGAEVVKSNYEGNVTITIQSAVRRLLGTGKSQAEIQETLKTYKPGTVVRTGVNVVEAFIKQFANATPEQKKALMDKLQGVASKPKP